MILILLKKQFLTSAELPDIMLNLLNEILDVSSIESGVVDIEKESIELDRLIIDKVNFMNKLGKSKDISGAFINEVDDSGKIKVNADRERLAQVMDNLLSNAIKYSQPGSKYEVFLKKEVEGFLVEVKDYGQGIPENEIPLVFEPFKRTSVMPTAGEKSTGLGLSIVKKIIEGHDGQIWVRSKENEGSTFSFILPG